MPLLSTLGAIAPYVLPTAQSYLSGRRQQEDERRFGKAQARANLINTLAPGSGAQPVFKPSDPGFLERGVEAANVGLGAYQGWQKFKAAQIAAQQAQTAAQQAIDAAEVEKQERLGAQQAVQALLAKDKESERLQSIAESQRIGTVPFQSIQEAEASGDPRLRVRPDVPLENIGEQLIAERDFPGVAEQRAAFLEETTTPRTGAAAVGYYEVMGEASRRRLEEGLSVEAQDIQRRRLELDKQRADDQSAYQRHRLEADEAALLVTKAHKTAKNIDDHRTTTLAALRKFSSVKRLDEFRRNYQAVKNLLDTIKVGQEEAKEMGVEYKISGTTQITLLNLFHNMIDPATVREGDILLYRTQAQGMFDRVQTDIKKIIDNQAGVISAELLDGMEGTLSVLKGGYEQSAAEQIGQFFKSQTDMGYELVPEAVITGLRDASFTSYGLMDPAESREILSERIKNLQESSDLTGQESSDYDGLSINVPSNTLGARNNNPGNLKWANQPGAEEGEGGFARFKTMEEGYAQLQRQIELDAERGDTLYEFIYGYAPPQDNNDTESYLADLIQATGATADTFLKDIDRNRLAEAVARRETSATFSAPTEDTAVSAAPATTLAKIGGVGRRGAEYPQTDFARMTDDQRQRLFGEYAARGGRFVAGTVLTNPLGLFGSFSPFLRAIK
mgnify:CR=1 FL=1